MTPDEAIARLQQKPNDSQAWELIYPHMQNRLNAYVTSLVYTFSSNTKESPAMSSTMPCLNFGIDGRISNRQFLMRRRPTLT